MSWQGGSNNNTGPGGNANNGFRRNSFRQTVGEEDGEIGEEEGEIVGTNTNTILPNTPLQPPSVPQPPTLNSTSVASSSSSSLTPTPASLHRGGGASNSSFSSSGPLQLRTFAAGSGSEQLQSRGNRGANPLGFLAGVGGALTSSRNPPPTQQQQQQVPSSSSSLPPSISQRPQPPQQQQQQPPLRGSGITGSGPPSFGSRPLRGGRGSGGLPPRSQSLTFQRPPSSAAPATASSTGNVSRPEGAMRSASFTPASSSLNKRPTDPRLQQATGRNPNFVPSADRLQQQQAQQQQQQQVPQLPPPQQQSSYEALPTRGSTFSGGDRTSSLGGITTPSSEPPQSSTVRSSGFHERAPVQQQSSGGGVIGSAFRSANFTPAGSDNRPQSSSSQSTLERRSAAGDRSTLSSHHQRQPQSHASVSSSTEHASGFTVRQSHHQPPLTTSASSSSLDRSGLLSEEQPMINPQPQLSYSSLAEASPFPIPKKRDNDERFVAAGDSSWGVRRDGRANYPPIGGSGGPDYSSRRGSTDLLRDNNSSASLSRSTGVNHDYYSGSSISNSNNPTSNEPALASSSAAARPLHGRVSAPNDARGFGSVASGSMVGRVQLGPSSGPTRPAFHRNDPRFNNKTEQQQLTPLPPPLSEPIRGASTEVRPGVSTTSSQQESALNEESTGASFSSDWKSWETAVPSDAAIPSRGGPLAGDVPSSSNVEQPCEGGPNGPQQQQQQQRSPPYRKKMFRASPLPPPLTSSKLLGAGGVSGDSTTRRPSSESVDSGFSGGRSRFGPQITGSSSPASRRPVLSYSSSSPSSSPRKLQQQPNRLALPPSAPTLNLVVDDNKVYPPPDAQTNTSTTSSLEPSSSRLTIPNLPSMNPSKPSEVVNPVRKPPLLTSALGQSKSRAEEAITLLKEIMSDDPNFKDEAGEVAFQLPAKNVIMTAMNQLNTKIEEVQTLVQGMESDYEEAQNLLSAQEANRIEKEEKERAAAEEQAKQEEEEERLRKEEEEARRKEEFLQFLECKRLTLEDEFKQEEKETEDRIFKIQENDRLRKQQQLDEQIDLASRKFDKDLSKARRELNRAEQAATKAEVKVATLEAENRSKRKEQEDVPQLKEEGPKSPSVSEVVANVLAENQRRAAEAHRCFPFEFATDDLLANRITAADNANLLGGELATDPKHNRTNFEWSILARQVTGPADALYSDPSDAPYFEHNERMHELIGPLVKEYIRDKQRRLEERWKELAVEYYVRKQIYGKRSNRSNVLKKTQRSMSISSRKSIFGDKVSATGSIASGIRNSSNPYRRSRRGNEVRSDYEQEQIMAEIAAKEAMEKRIAHGGSYIPRQVIPLEKEMVAVFIKDFDAQRMHDPMAAEEALSVTNVWSDMEKAIFLDRFLQHPKDFRKIATFLRNKTAKDCVAFYYNSKKTVPYKTALKEHIMRRKRRGDYPVWDATVQAAVSVGAIVSPGNSEERPLSFSLPDDEGTYFTHTLHPMKLKTFDGLVVSDDAANVEPEISEKQKSRKRGMDPLFVVDPAVQKLLRSSKDPNQASIADTANELQGSESVSGRITPVKRIPQKWTTSERKLFLEAVNKYGKDWSMLVSAVGTKSLPQIKNYYYDYKKQSGKRRNSMDNLQPEEKRIKVSISEKLRRDTTTETSLPSPPDESADTQDDIKEDITAWVQPIEQQQEEEQQLELMPEDEPLASSSSAAIGLAESDLWAQVQQQALLQSQQQQQQQQQQHPLQHSPFSLDDTLRLLQHHNQTQQQQQQQQLLSWISATQAAQAHAAALQQQQQQHRQQNHPADAAVLAAAFTGNGQGAGHNAQEWGDLTTQMQSFLSLRQGGHHPFALPSAATSSHLSSLALAGLGGLSHLHLDSTVQPTQQRGSVATDGGILGSATTVNANAMSHGFLYPSLGNHDGGRGSVLDVLGLLAAAQGRPTNTRGDSTGVYHHHPFNIDGSNPNGTDRQDNY